MRKEKTPDELISGVLKGSMEKKMKMDKVKGSLAALIMIVPLAFLFGLFIKLLWNWLMPVLFSLPTVTYWQGVGIFILGRFLFSK